jgi:hypothetical protein
VCLHGTHGQCQFRCNRLVAHPEHHVTQDVGFAGRQRLLLHAVSYPAGNEGAYRDATHVHGSQPINQVLQAASQQQVTARSLLERMADLRLAVAVSQDHDSPAERAC